MLNKHKLTNREISLYYRNYDFWLMPSDFLGAFSYWAIAQNQNGTFFVEKPLKAFHDYVKEEFGNIKDPKLFNYDRLNALINEEAFMKIPEILDLNKMKPDFIDLCALSRNVFYMIMRECIME